MKMSSASLTLEEFNGRAVRAMRTVDLAENSFDDEFMKTVSKLIERGFRVSERQQLTLFRVVHHHRSSIWDALVNLYAAQRIKEAT